MDPHCSQAPKSFIRIYYTTSSPSPQLEISKNPFRKTPQTGGIPRPRFIYYTTSSPSKILLLSLTSSLTIHCDSSMIFPVSACARLKSSTRILCVEYSSRKRFICKLRAWRSIFRTTSPLLVAVPQAVCRDVVVVGGTAIWISKGEVVEGSEGDDAGRGGGFGWRFMGEDLRVLRAGLRRYVCYQRNSSGWQGGAVGQERERERE